MERWFKWNRISTYLLNFFYLNLLWYTFVMLGLGVFGLFPATAASFKIVGSWLNGDLDGKLFDQFKIYFAKYFIPTNGFAVIFYLVCFSLFFLSSVLPPIIYVAYFVAIGLLFIPVYTFLLLVFTQYQPGFWQALKQSFLVAIFSPRELFAMVLTLGLVIFLTYLLPGIMLFLNPSLLVLSFVYFGQLAFDRLVTESQESNL